MVKVMVWAWVNQEIKELVEKLAESKGISISEYVRSLVLQDLDQRSLFTTNLKAKAQAIGATPGRCGSSVDP